MKKLFAILMSIMMIACFMPTMVFAEEDAPQNPDARLEIRPVKVDGKSVLPNLKNSAVNAEADKGAEVKITYEVSIIPAEGAMLTEVKFKFVPPTGMTLAANADETTGYKLESVPEDMIAKYENLTYTLSDGNGTKNISQETKLMTIVATIDGSSTRKHNMLDVVLDETKIDTLAVKKWEASASTEATATVEAITVELTRLIGGSEEITVTAPVKYVAPQARLELKDKDFTGTITWKETYSAEGSEPVTKFKAGTAYTATVTLTATSTEDKKYAFKREGNNQFAVKVGEKTPNITFSENNTKATFSVDFPKTAAAVAPTLNIDVKDNIVYDGEALVCQKTGDTGFDATDADVTVNYTGDVTVETSWHANQKGKDGDEPAEAALSSAPQDAGVYWIKAVALSKADGKTELSNQSKRVEIKKVTSTLMFTVKDPIVYDGQPVTCTKEEGANIKYAYDGDPSTPEVKITWKDAEENPLDAAPTDAGDYFVTVSVAETANYNAVTETKEFAIAKADIDAANKTADVTVQKGTKGLVALSGKIAEGATIGDITIQGGKAEWFAGDADAPKVVNGNLSFKLTDQATTEDQNNTATLTIPVKGATNYKDYEIVVTVTASESEQAAVVIPPVAKTGLEYDGTDQPLVTAGEATSGEMQYSLTKAGTYSKNIPTGKNADRYTVYYKVVKDGNDVNESNANGNVPVTIAKKPVTVQPESFTIKQGDTLPTLVLKYVGLLDGDKLTGEEGFAPAFEYLQNDTKVEKPEAVGEYTIKWTSKTEDEKKFTNANYQVTPVETATLTIKAKTPSGGGSYYPYTPSTPSKPAAPNLDKTKTDSTAALNAAATANKYDAAEQAEVKKILDKANADIKNAKTEAEVKAIEEAAQAEIDKILTTEEKAIVAALDNVEKRDFETKSKVITRKSGKKVIRLTWTAPDGVDVDGYEIFRSTKKNSGFGTKPYFETTSTSYTNTKNLKPGKIYYYKVRAFVVINGERVYTDYSLQAFRTIK